MFLRVSVKTSVKQRVGRDTRSATERCVNELNERRGVARRYEKRAENYQAMLTVAAIMPRL